MDPADVRVTAIEQLRKPRRRRALVWRVANRPTFAGAACGRDARREEEAMRWHRRRRATPQIGRNRHQPEGLRAARGHLRRCRSSTMAGHRLRRGASHLAPRRPQRIPVYLRHATLARGYVSSRQTDQSRRSVPSNGDLADAQELLEGNVGQPTLTIGLRGCAKERTGGVLRSIVSTHTVVRDAPSQLVSHPEAFWEIALSDSTTQPGSIPVNLEADHLPSYSHLERPRRTKSSLTQLEPAPDGAAAFPSGAK